jgi:hypothetical protein
MPVVRTAEPDSAAQLPLSAVELADLNELAGRIKAPETGVGRCVELTVTVLGDLLPVTAITGS